MMHQSVGQIGVNIYIYIFFKYKQLVQKVSFTVPIALTEDVGWQWQEIHRGFLFC